MRLKKNNQGAVATRVKDEDLVKMCRRQIVNSAVSLMIKNGYHKTTTRMLAKEIGKSMGSLYEYISCKDDIIFLICDAIRNEFGQGLEEATGFSTGGRLAIRKIIREYFLVCNRLSDHTVVIYQILHLLPLKWRKEVLEWEVLFTNRFIETMKQFKEDEVLNIEDDTIYIIGHNISVLGHAWAFRRWYFSKHFTVEQYIEKQTNIVMAILSGQRK